MPGGLMQLTFSGKENLYLNKDPEITFFKKIYRRHTNFSTELKEIKFNNSQKYSENINFNVKNQGDLLYDCYLEVVIPSLSFNDSIIDDLDYENYKTNLLSSIEDKKNEWKLSYDNFKNFSSIELVYYRTLVNSLQSDNITIAILKSKVSTLNETYETDRNTYKSEIDQSILAEVNIVSYINGLDSEEISEIKTVLSKKYNLIERYLKYYYSNYIYKSKEYDNLDEGKINYAWTEQLGHYYFSNYEIQIGGTKIDNYSSDQLHIYQTHNLDESRKDNYNEMIGNVETLYKFSSDSRKEMKIYIPLIFWFCRNSSSSLPLLCLKNSEVTFNFKLNSLENLIYFVDWETDYNNLLIIDVPLADHQKNTNGSIIEMSELNYESVDLIVPEYIYRYTCKNINKKLLDLKYPGIDSDLVLENYGTLQDDSSYILTLNDYVYLMNNIKDDTKLDNDTKIKLAGYHYFVDYNYLINQVDTPKIKLFGNYVYLDDLERDKFIKSKIEYLIDLHSEDSLSIGDTSFFSHDFDMNKLIKLMYWYVKPKLYTEGISKYGKKYNNIYNKYNFYENNILEDIELYFDRFDFLKQSKYKNYYSVFKPYTLLNNKLDDGVNMMNFSLYPEKTQPSGSLNIIDINNKSVKIKLNEDFRTEYFDDFYPKSLNPNNYEIEFKLLLKSYNVLYFTKGEGKLIFYHK